MIKFDLKKPRLITNQSQIYFNQTKAKIDKFVQDDTAKQIEFQPMEKILRGIV